MFVYMPDLFSIAQQSYEFCRKKITLFSVKRDWKRGHTFHAELVQYWCLILSQNFVDLATFLGVGNFEATQMGWTYEVNSFFLSLEKRTELPNSDRGNRRDVCLASLPLSLSRCRASHKSSFYLSSDGKTTLRETGPTDRTTAASLSSVHSCCKS